MAVFVGDVGFLAKGGLEGEVGLEVRGGGPLLVLVEAAAVDDGV